MNKLHILVLIGLLTLISPVASFAQAPPWTMVIGAGGLPDEGSINNYVVTGGGQELAPSGMTISGLGTNTFRYNVTDIGMNPQPGWNTFELGYTDTSANAVITATLFRVDRCTGLNVQLCQITSVTGNVNFCQTCTPFPELIDFTLNLYYVQVDITRTAAGGNIKPKTLRIF